MIQPESAPAAVPARRTILYVLLGMLGIACLVIPKPVLAPLIWAATYGKASPCSRGAHYSCIPLTTCCVQC